jgi:predicted transcriptional regulator
MSQPHSGQSWDILAKCEVCERIQCDAPAEVRLLFELEVRNVDTAVV